MVLRLVVASSVLAALGLDFRSLPAQSDRHLDAAQVHDALDDFHDALNERWSYRRANGADFDAAIAALRSKVAAGMSADELGLELHKIVALGVDGHAGVDGYQLPGSRYLPFLIEPDEERAIAFSADRTAFLVDQLPYLTQIDGRDVRDWCAAAEMLVSKGSAPYRRHRCLAGLRHIDFLRGLLSLPLQDSVEVTVASSDGREHSTLTLRASDALPDYGKWPPGGSRLLEGNIGYLRLVTMVESSSVAEIEQWMPRFRDTTGLIVDVRDNTGGDRDALRLMHSYLAAPDDPPRVFTAAAYRLHAAHPSDHLAANHRMYREDAAQWSSAQRQAIAGFMRTFSPEWELPEGQFSDWHYMVLTRLDDPDIYHYDKPAVVLMNGKSFSATDIFLAGLRGMKNVTLLGTPSAGGSAFTQEIALGATPLRLRIGSMVSFQADGRLFDGRGVGPDVIVVPTPEYYIGGPDDMLAAAVRRLASR